MHTQPGIHTPETALGKGCEKGAAPVSALTAREEFYSSFFKSFIHWWEKNPKHCSVGENTSDTKAFVIR